MVQGNFIVSLSIVFLVGAVVAVILSYFLTRKLVTPLSRLKRQLKKIENRQFDAIERIKATGEIKEVEQSVYDMAEELLDRKSVVYGKSGEIGGGGLGER